ncbi:MAG: L-dopachrome tautomerase-related protein [Fimbriimonas sp.]
MTTLLALGALTLAAPQSAEIVHKFYGDMPAGVTVSRSGRIFVTIPRWDKPERIKYTLLELRNGKEVPYPNAQLNRLDKRKAATQLINVQSAYVDEKDRLWAVDTGSVNFGPVHPDGAKLVCFDLDANRVVRTIRFPEKVVHGLSYLNDVRFDFTRGSEGYAFLTDSSDKGANGIVVVDLSSGESWRRLNDHPSTRPQTDVNVMAEGRPLKLRPAMGGEGPVTVGSDGIAIDPKGGKLYYCPLIGRSLYSVDLDALVDRHRSEDAVAATVKEVERKPASDGLHRDFQGRVIITDYENSRLQRLRTDGTFESILTLEKKYWPDTMYLTDDGSLYLIANQLQRRPPYNRGKDLRKPPYLLMRMKLPN